MNLLASLSLMLLLLVLVMGLDWVVCEQAAKYGVSPTSAGDILGLGVITFYAVHRLLKAIV